MMKIFRILAVCVAMTASAVTFAQTKQTVSSPDGNIKVDITLDRGITYDVYCGDELVLDDCRLALDVDGNVLGSSPKLAKAVRKTIDEVKTPFLRLKYKEVRNHCNELTLKFKGDYSVVFRAYDDGVAYRFVTAFPGDVNVNGEDITVIFPEETDLILQQSDSFVTSYEEKYTKHTTHNWTSQDKIVHMPVLAVTPGGTNVLISESDLIDYPAAFFRSNDAGGFTSEFPKVPKVTGPDGDRSVAIIRCEDYIARTSGTRNFPWRYFVISKEDAGLVETTMTCRLAQDSCLDDVSWIKPGKAS